MMRYTSQTICISQGISYNYRNNTQSFQRLLITFGMCVNDEEMFEYKDSAVKPGSVL